MAATPDPYVEERQAEILGAAQAVFIRRGFERATMQEIATEAGLSAGAIYRYFPGKESLITAVCAAAGAGHLDHFVDDPERGPAIQTLLSGGEAVWHALFRTAEGQDSLRMYLEAALAALRHPESIGDELAADMAAKVDQLTAVVEAAKREGSLDADLDARALGTLLLATTEGMHVLHGQVRGDVDVDTVWELLVQMISALGPTDAQSEEANNG